MKQVTEILSKKAQKNNKPAFKIISLVSKKTGISEQNQALQSYQQGGTYIRLENEWRETLKQRNSNAKVIKSKWILSPATENYARKIELLKSLFRSIEKRKFVNFAT